MITLKNKELELVLLTILVKNPEGNIVTGGLLSEKLPLSIKRRLEKIFKTTLEHYKEFLRNLQEINKIEDQEGKKKELSILLEEEVFIDTEKIQISLIEEINTANIYDFSIIEKFAE